MTHGNHLIQGPSLRFKIFALLSALVLTSLVWAGVTLWYNHKTRDLIVDMADKDITALVAAQGLESSLNAQKGYATYYFLNGNPEWLDKLKTHRRDFEKWLLKARDSAYDGSARENLNRIETEYLKYILFKDQVLALYQSGKRDEGAALHWTSRDQFEAVYGLCEGYRRLHEDRLQATMTKAHNQTRKVIMITWASVPMAVMLAVVLGGVLLGKVLMPLRRLAMGGDNPDQSALLDEVKALSQRMESLVEDVDKTHSKLRESRAHLQQSEKMAQVGKLAAGVAHSIRNPLTSVKMRLFSLERSLTLNEVQKEDFEVISEEIRHLDSIIRNFLEFSRPPKLKVTRVCPSEVVDMTLNLLRHRLDSCNVEVVVRRDAPLAEIDADADQLKEVIANLLLNACEAMPGGGSITIEEGSGVMEPQGRVMVIRISDTGPGIPPEHSEQIFQPFFSTKEEGTGLGLSIAKRIMEEHGGWINFVPGEGRGATFVLMLPSKDSSLWHRF